MAKVMIVDDALFMRKMLAKILVEAGHEICAEAGNAKEAVEKYKKVKPDLVTMDIVMPLMEEMDGIGAVKEIIRIDPQAKILVCSVMGQQSLVVEAIRSGAKDFVIKPIKPERLIDAVNKAILSGDKK
jgi:two-component system, chemotaxis family, chemotaxis protein CheY